MELKPYLSVVVGARNDDHGGDFLSRFQLFLNTLHSHFQGSDLSVEVVIVEWNPPIDRPPLRDALDWPQTSRSFSVKIVTFPPKLHDELSGGSSLSFHQMIAKNVGIRRATGRFVLATNADILFSSALANFLRHKSLDAGSIFRANRHDIPAEPPDQLSLGDFMAYCEKETFRRHMAVGTISASDPVAQEWLLSLRRSILSLTLFSKSWPVSYPLFGLLGSLFQLNVNGSTSSTWARYQHAIARADRYAKFYRLCGLAHTNACGDFTLMAKEDWETVGGYPEWPNHPMHMDGILCYAALFKGIRERTLPPSHCVYHMEHGGPTGFQNYGEAAYWENSDQSGTRRLTDDDYLEIVEDLFRGREAVPLAGENWGLADYELDEQRIGS